MILFANWENHAEKLGDIAKINWVISPINFCHLFTLSPNLINIYCRLPSCSFNYFSIYKKSQIQVFFHTYFFPPTKQHVSDNFQKWHLFCFSQYKNRKKSVLLLLQYQSTWIRPYDNYGGEKMIPIQHMTIHFCTSVILWAILIKLIF